MYCVYLCVLCVCVYVYVCVDGLSAHVIVSQLLSPSSFLFPSTSSSLLLSPILLLECSVYSDMCVAESGAINELYGFNLLF